MCKLCGDEDDECYTICHLCEREVCKENEICEECEGCSVDICGECLVNENRNVYCHQCALAEAERYLYNKMLIKLGYMSIK